MCKNENQAMGIGILQEMYVKFETNVDKNDFFNTCFQEGILISLFCSFMVGYIHNYSFHYIILPLSTNFQLEFGNVPTVWYYFLHFILFMNRCLFFNN